MLRNKIKLALLGAVLAGSILVPSYHSVNSNADEKGGARWADGSPMPIPKPPASQVLVADGSPMPIPRPPGQA